MRFWQKTYLFTLALFLLCMDAGIFSLTVYTHRENLNAAETAAAAEQTYLAVSFERDWADMQSASTGFASPSLLMRSFGGYCQRKGADLVFRKDGETVYSAAGLSYDVPTNSLVHTVVSGKRHIVISKTVCGGEYEMLYAKDVSTLDEQFRRQAVTYAATALCVSVVLALGLYFLLKRLSAPLEKLRKVTEKIQAGDLTVRAEEKGKDEFALLGGSFNAMLEKIDEQMKRLEEDAKRKQMLVDNMAHELRTPLTSIRGYAEFLEKAAGSEEQKRLAVGYILSESERLRKISELLLDSAKARENPPEMREIALSPILADSADRLRARATRAGVTLTVLPGETRIRGNETLLSVLFSNLTENAVKACSPGGHVRLSCTAGGALVEDDGAGMTAEQLSRVTEPFYRVDKSRSRSEGGAGLGLALCKQIVLLHGGEMLISSKVGEGTKIFLDFTSRQQSGDKSDTRR